MRSVKYAKKYDVIIVGAGPGGLRCAEVLGKEGKKVLVVEKNDVIGPKVCAGGLTRKAITYLRRNGMPSDIIERTFTGIVFRIGRMRTYIDFGTVFLYTVTRRALGSWQYEKVRTLQTVTICTGVTVTKITQKYIVIDGKQKVQYDFLVGADGAASIVRRFCGLDTHMYGVAFHYKVPLQKKHENIEIIFDTRLFRSWYAWIFPYRGSSSVGTGYFPRVMSAQKAIDNFHKWLKREHIDKADISLEAHPINCDYRGYCFDYIFLVGDAAGFTSGFTGEGIYQALMSGEEVAHKIVDPSYESTVIPEILREKRIHEILLRTLMIIGPLRNIAFYIVVLVVKIPFFGKMLLRILT